mgnify:CR=1 FL=1
MAARYQHVIRFGVMQPTVFNHLSSWAPFRSNRLRSFSAPCLAVWRWWLTPAEAWVPAAPLVRRFGAVYHLGPEQSLTGLGVFNAMNVTWDAEEGYSSIPHGSSFIMAVHFQDGACPDGWSRAR